MVVGVAAVEEENVKERERDVMGGSEWWWWWPRKHLDVVVVAAEAKPWRERERDEREVGSNGNRGGEALRGRKKMHCEGGRRSTAHARKKKKQQQRE